MKNYLKHKHHRVLCPNCGKLISKDYCDIDDPEWDSHFEDITIEEYCDCNIPTYYWCETCNEDF
jgi:hypothetical protein